MIGDTVLLCGFTERCIVTVHDHGALVVASADMALEDLNTCVLTAIDALLTTQREAQQC